jgi:hypothetical protein
MVTGIEVPSLAGLIAAIKFLIDQTTIPAAKRKQWFEDHIEPSYKQLCAIHKDYSKQFSNALNLLTKGTNLEEVVEVLKRDRPNLLLKRQEVRESLLALRNYRLEKKRKPKVVILFYDYVSSVDEYLNAASPLPRGTWYSYFIDRFSEIVQQGKNPLSYDYPGCAQGRRAPNLAKEQLEAAVQKYMPEAMRQVQANYAKLRTECLAQV